MPLRGTQGPRRYYKPTLKANTIVSSGFSTGTGHSVTPSGQIVKKPKKGQTLTKFIKNVASGLSETKRVIWYGSPQTNNVATGLLVDEGIDPHNQLISNNNTDIRRIIPIVAEGTGDNERIGESIRPVSLMVRGRVGVNVIPNTQPPVIMGNQDLQVILYVLQHKSLKSYQNLYANNNFGQLLETGEQATRQFSGYMIDGTLPVSNQYYTLIKKKKIVLRWAGQNAPTIAGSTGNTTGANSHNYALDFKLNLKKHLPAKLLYPENTAPAPGLNDPTNSSLFFCLGFIPYAVQDSVASTPVLLVNLQYTAEMLYKDA